MAIIDVDFWLVRRKLLGAVGATHRGAVTLRMHAGSCNANRSRQQITRRNLAILSTAWNGVLTETNRDTWWFVQGLLPWRDYLEQYKDLQGFHWFAGLNARLMRAGLAYRLEANWGLGGTDLSSLSVAFLSATSVRVTYAPNMAGTQRLVVFSTGPIAVGRNVVAPVWTWDVMSTPRGWLWVGVSGQAAASPQDFLLPWRIEAGVKVGIMAGGMNVAGVYCQNWKAADATRL